MVHMYLTLTASGISPCCSSRVRCTHEKDALCNKNTIGAVIVDTTTGVVQKPMHLFLIIAQELKCN